MQVESNGHEHELEPQHGLPERLPQGERILWQGAPDRGSIARRVFHLRKLAIYFAGLLLLTAGVMASEGAGSATILETVGWLALAACVALVSIGSLAWFTAATTVYTITDKRVVMRIGIVLTVTFNLPFKWIAGAELRPLGGRHGDIALSIAGDTRIAWLQLWPHVRPWRLRNPEPMLRSVVDAERVAATLSEAWAARNGVAIASSAPAPEPAVPPATPATEPRRAPRFEPSLT